MVSSESISYPTSRDSSEYPPETTALESWEAVENAVSSNKRLVALYGQVDQAIRHYISAMRRHVRIASGVQSFRVSDPDDTLEKSRFEAHNDLIAKAEALGAAMQEHGLDTQWLDALQEERPGKRYREQVHDWATDIWLEREERSDNTRKRVRRAK